MTKNFLAGYRRRRSFLERNKPPNMSPIDLHKEETLRKLMTLLFILLLAAILAVLFVSRPQPVTSEPVATSPFSDGCVFYKKVQGGDMVISEPKAGSYRYEVYATSDGIELWKCN